MWCQRPNVYLPPPKFSWYDGASAPRATFARIFATLCIPPPVWAFARSRGSLYRGFVVSRDHCIYNKYVIKWTNDVTLTPPVTSPSFLAEISVSSPWTLSIFIIYTNLSGWKYPKNMSFNFENSTAGDLLPRENTLWRDVSSRIIHLLPKAQRFATWCSALVWQQRAIFARVCYDCNQSTFLRPLNTAKWLVHHEFLLVRISEVFLKLNWISW